MFRQEFYSTNFEMPVKFIFILSILFTLNKVSCQDISYYLRDNAVKIENSQNLNESVSNLLSPFQIIMMGEIHGTNEPAEFVIGLAMLLTGKGDSVQIGLEIPVGQMTQFLLMHTDSSIYSSNFFLQPKFESGRESMAWAGIISKLKNNPKIELFFYDVNADEGKPFQRDNLMYTKIKRQFKLHPSWKMITLSGNAHNTNLEGNSMSSYLRDDKDLNLAVKICTLNHEYLQGTCLANFGKGLEVKQIGHPASFYDTTLTCDKYLVLMPSKSDYGYTGFYYTKNITSSKMVNN